MKSLKILALVCSLFYIAPALASDVVVDLGGKLPPKTTRAPSTEEQELLFRQKEATDDREVFKLQRKPSRTCWQASKPYVITCGIFLGLCGVAIGGVISWSEACLSLLAHNGTSQFCANNSTNNTGGLIPWIGIP